MKLGMTLPTMAGGYTRATTLDWCRRIDGGPYESVSAGERITFRNQEQLVALSAAAALTERVKVVATIVVLPMHPTALVAKRMAALDVLSGGRLIVGVGVGGRDHDYRSAGAPFGRRHQRLDEQVAELRSLWSGELPFEGAEPVGPPPLQDGGPPVWTSAFGPKSLARASRWADGYAGFTLGADEGELAGTVAAVEQAWQDAGRTERPYLMTSFWCSLGPDAAERHRRYAHEYMAVAGADLAGFMADAATVVGEDALRRAADAVEAAGFDELMLVPTTTDVSELDRIEAVVSGR